jgi:hypothetical protein
MPVTKTYFIPEECLYNMHGIFHLHSLIYSLIRTFIEKLFHARWQKFMNKFRNKVCYPQEAHILVFKKEMKGARNSGAHLFS